MAMKMSSPSFLLFLLAFTVTATFASSAGDVDVEPKSFNATTIRLPTESAELSTRHLTEASMSGTPWPTETVLSGRPTATLPSSQPTGFPAPGDSYPGNGSGSGSWPANVPDWLKLIPKNVLTIRIAHAALAASAFLLFFPIGAIMVRIWDSRIGRYQHIVWVHAFMQGFGYIVFVTAAGLGIYMAKHFHSLNKYHPIIGICLLSLLALQPLTELFNHYFYDRYPRIVLAGHVHVWLGRVLLLGGIVNGGLGFGFAETIPGPNWPVWPKIAYGVIATLVVILYIAITIVWHELRNNRVALAGNGLESATREVAGANAQADSVTDHASREERNRDERSSGPDAERKKSFRSSAL